MKTGRDTLKNHLRIALAVTVLATIILGFPAFGQAKGNGQQKQGNAAQPTAAVMDPETKPLAGAAASGTAAGAASGTGDAGAAAATAAEAASAPMVSTWDFVRMLLVLALVVGAIYLVFHLLRKGAGGKTPENNLIRVLGSRNLSGSRAMHLVEVGKSVYLVGSSDGGVELIAEVTNQESLDMVRLQAAEEPTARRRGFQEALADLLRPSKKPDSMKDGLRFLRSQRERLKKL